MKFERPPQTQEHQLAQPDSPGLWLFKGTVHLPSRDVSDAMELILKDWYFAVVQDGDTLRITDPDSGTPFGGEWIGSWEKMKESIMQR